MTIGKAVQCKVCEKFAWTLNNGTPALNWLTLKRVESSSWSSGDPYDKKDGYETEHHFCSGKCLREHIKKWA